MKRVLLTIAAALTLTAPAFSQQTVSDKDLATALWVIGQTMPDGFTLDLLTNRAVLAMHKNARGAHPVWRRKRDGKEWILWTAENAAGGHYLALFNAGEEDGEITVPLCDIELDGEHTLTEMWTGAVTGPADSVTVCLPKHGAAAWEVE
jgi:hypothetical protein